MSNTHAQPKPKAVVVGAGPVGCLAAAGLAKLGWAVDIYEARPGKWSPRPARNAHTRIL
jgi:kynurenine 3-monooxygenase